MATNWDSTDVLQAYLEALAHAYDPHSDYLNNAHAQDFSINMSLSLFGIGAQLIGGRRLLHHQQADPRRPGGQKQTAE